ncbi:MAG: flavodoxin [Chloroflexi bacterium]|nr:flavodoxin [Chloroflexota bacterium]
MATVLVLFDSRASLVRELARAVCEGIALVPGADAHSRDVEEARPDELLRCDALVLGSANWTGVTGRLKTWLDESGDLWESGELAGKPGAAFAAGWSPHGGLEATLLQLVHLILGHGMLFLGLPWSERMRRSGSYYGATAVAVLTNDDREQARALGARVAALAVRLAS